MDFKSQRLADVVVAAPVGQIDHPNAVRLQQVLGPIVDEAVAQRRPLVIDFSGVEYISSMGLRVLMVAAKQMRSHGASIALGGLQPEVEEIFEIARFKFVLDIYPTVRAALEKVSAAAAVAYDDASR